MILCAMLSALRPGTLRSSEGYLRNKSKTAQTILGTESYLHKGLTPNVAINGRSDTEPVAAGSRRSTLETQVEVCM